MKKNMIFLAFVMMASPLLCLSSESCVDDICTLSSVTVVNLAMNDLEVGSLYSGNIYGSVKPSDPTSCFSNEVSFNPTTSTGTFMFSIMLNAKLNSQLINLKYKKVVTAPYITECELLLVSS